MAARVVPLESSPVNSSGTAVEWPRVAALLHVSRALDEIEETRLVPERKVLYQFSARGHELSQILLGMQLTQPHDAAAVYYRARPLMLCRGCGRRAACAGGFL
jgi:2-oxoisovalerate dehydrogenase E1 component